MARVSNHVSDVPVVAHRSVALDVLRIFAAVWVVSFHWSNHGGFYPTVDLPRDVGLPPAIAAFTEIGWLGVDIFFILSGAVIARSAMNRRWFEFARSRFLRLFPVYFVVVVLSIIIVPIVVRASSRFDYLPSLSGLNFWTGSPGIVGAAWTLPIEVQFYAFTAFLIWRYGSLSADQVRTGALWFLLLSLVARLSGWSVLNALFMSDWAPYFALGALVSITTTKEELKKNLLGIAVAAALSAVQLNARVTGVDPQFGPAHRWILVVVVLVIVLSFLFTASFQWGKVRLSPGVRRVIETASLMTYPLYLLHQQIGLSLVVILLATTGMSLPLGMIVVALVVLILSFVLTRWVEPGMRALMTRLFGWRPRAQK